MNFKGRAVTRLCCYMRECELMKSCSLFSFIIIHIVLPSDQAFVCSFSRLPFLWGTSFQSTCVIHMGFSTLACCTFFIPPFNQSYTTLSNKIKLIARAFARAPTCFVFWWRCKPNSKRGSGGGQGPWNRMQ